MKMQIVALLCMALPMYMAHEHTYYETAYEMMEDALTKAGDFFSHKFQDAKDFAATTPDEMRTRLKDTQAYLETLKKNKDQIYKHASKESKAALDKVNEYYDITAKYAKEAKDVSTDKYADLSKRWEKQSNDMYKNGFSDLVKIAQVGKKNAKDALDNAEPYYSSAYEAVKDALAKGSDYFSDKFQDAKDFAAKTPEEFQTRLKDTQHLLDTINAKKDVLYKTASKDSKVALDKLKEWSDSTAKYAKEAKGVTGDKYTELSKRWDKQSSEMYKNGFNDLVKIAKQGKKAAKDKMDDAEPYYTSAYEAVKDALAKGSDYFSHKFEDAKDFAAKTPEEFQTRMKDTQHLLDTIKAKKDVLYKSASKDSKAALDRLQEWSDSTAKYAKEGKNVASDKFDDLNKRWSKSSEEMYKNGFNDLVKISQKANKSGRKAVKDAADSGEEYYAGAAAILKDGLATLSDFFTARFYDAKDLLAHTPEDLRKRVKDTQELIETIASRKGEYYAIASEKSKVALDNLEHWYESTKEFTAEAADVSADKFADLNTRWSAKSNDMYSTGFDDLIRIAQEAKKTLKKKIDEL